MYAFLTIFLVAILLIGFIIVLGVSSPISNHVKQAEIFPTTADRIWAILTGIESIPKFRKDIKRIRISGQNREGYLIWSEFSSFGMRKEFEIIEQAKAKRIVFHLKDSSFGTKGKWAFDLHEKNGETVVTITENSLTPSIIGRSIFRIAGRDKQLAKAFKMIDHIIRLDQKPKAQETSSNLTS